MNDIQGVPFAELAKVHGVEWTGSPAHNKRMAGAVVEAALGLKPSSKPKPDIEPLNIEVKTIPLSDDLRVLEHTKVTSLNPQDVVRDAWEQSTAYQKLRSILFVPVVKYDLNDPSRWYIRSPFVWFPSTSEMEQFRKDYESVRTLLASGRPEDIHSAEPPEGQGEFLIANTGGQSGETTKYEVGERTLVMKRRAWMLRKRFTRHVVENNISYAVLLSKEHAKGGT